MNKVAKAGDDFIVVENEKKAKEINIPCFSVLGDLILNFSKILNQKASHQPSGQHVLNDEYYERIEAIQFTMNHDDGNLLEPQQDEIYFYKFQKPEAYAIQQIYTKEEDQPDESLDEIYRAQNNDVVLVPRGYHPVVAEHGYNCYYLNFLAGTDQSLLNTTDSNHEWIYESWKEKDNRLPLVTAEMNNLKNEF